MPEVWHRGIITTEKTEMKWDSRRLEAEIEDVVVGVAEAGAAEVEVVAEAVEVGEAEKVAAPEAAARDNKEVETAILGARVEIHRTTEINLMHIEMIINNNNININSSHSKISDAIRTIIIITLKNISSRRGGSKIILNQTLPPGTINHNKIKCRSGHRITLQIRRRCTRSFRRCKRINKHLGR